MGGWGSRVLNYFSDKTMSCLYGIFDHSKHIISPQSERSELGAFYFFQGFQVVTVVCVRVVTVIECAIWGSSEKWQIHVLGSHFSRLLVTASER